jgi:hypothetical protein
MILTHGSRRFWLDDIWEKDWSSFLLQQGMSGHVSPPPRLLRAGLDITQSLIETAAALRRRLIT